MSSHTIPAPICDALLFLARASLPVHDRDRAREICALVDDWPKLMDIAQRKFSLPFVYRNLQRLPLGVDYAPMLAAMRAQVLPATFGALRVLAAQRRFHSDCVTLLNGPHVYLKGPSLAMRYYDDPGLRFARDIDILVSRDDQEALVRHALAAGYSLYDQDVLQAHQVKERDLQAVLTYKTATTLLTPDNIVIEVHRNIDKRLGLFAEDAVLKRRDMMRDGDNAYGIMTTTDLFCYICYHNTRHIWSRLHWIADLDAMVAHPTFDRQVTLERATKLGLHACVEACLDLHQIAISGQASHLTKGSGRGAQLAAICCENLKGDLELEYELRKNEDLIGLPFDWMVSAEVRKRASNLTRLSRILPSYEDYEAWPLPRALQWMYYISKPFGILKRRLGLPNKWNANP